MAITIHRLTEPTNEILTVQDVKGFLRIDDTISDTDVSQLLTTSREYLEDETGLCFGVSTYRLFIDSFKEITIPRYPLDVDTLVITYTDTDGTEQTLDASLYTIVHEEIPARLVFDENVPELEDDKLYPVKIEFSAGYTQSNAPKRAITCMKLLITHYFNHRDLSDKRIDYEIPVPQRIRHFVNGMKKWRFL